MSEKDEQSAIETAEKWLTLVDEGNFSESWNQTASLFKAAVTEEEWKNSLESVQNSLGKAISRSLKSKQFANELPGAPDGDYVVIQYDTSFEQKKNGVETITPMKDKDGNWRVSGYYIK